MALTNTAGNSGSPADYQAVVCCVTRNDLPVMSEQFVLPGERLIQPRFYDFYSTPQSFSVNVFFS